jgi:AraC-like DNA-binding protein
MLGVCLKYGAAHEVLADGRSLTYPADALCLRPPDCVWWCDRTGPAAFVSIDVDAALLPERRVPGSMAFAHASTLPDFSAFVRELCYVRDPMYAEERVAALVLALHDSGAIESRELAGRVVPGAVARARAILDEEADRPPSLDELASRVGQNKFVLLRAFRREVGLPPRTYAVGRRLARARELIARGVPFTEVVGRCGFSDQAHLSRQFRANVGLTPGQYAKLVRRSIHGGR